MKLKNPFTISGYVSPQYFCNRQQETKRIFEAIDNQRNLTIISHRRLGKSGLIHHAFHLHSQNSKLHYVYVDLMHTTSMQELIQAFAKSVIGKFDNKTTQVIKRFGNIVKSIRPNITIDSITGQPNIELNHIPGSRIESSLEEVFSYIKSLDVQVVIAFDEFQQILNYAEKNVEALLRSHIQQTQNAVFIYSGSQKHLLMSMFHDYSRPFYQSTEILNLEKIDENEYQKFIINHFELSKYKIDPLVVNLILNLTIGHTYYVQYLCNRIFSLREKNIDSILVKEMLLKILQENEVVYFNYRNLLTKHQFNLLEAIAKEEGVSQPTSKEFLNNYKLGAVSTVKSSLKALQNKEMIFEEKGSWYVYDVFFSKWLERI